MMNNLASDKKTLYSVACLTLALLLSIIAIRLKYLKWIAAAIFLVAALITCFSVKKRSILSYHKRKILLIAFLSAAFYLVLYYLSGLNFGFGTLLIDSSVIGRVSYVVPITVIILACELIRSILLGQKCKLIPIIAYLIGVLSEVAIYGGIHGITTSYKLMDFIGLNLFPAMTANVLFNYVSVRYGMWPNVAYRLILTLYVYIFPIVPDAPQILSAFALVILPLAVWLLIDLSYEKKRRYAKEKKSALGFVFTSVFLVIMALFVMLVSCQFRYGILVIASPSMSDEINIGDAVIFESYDNIDSVGENDVIVFSKDGKTKVVHRIIEVNIVDGQKRYITKGDANKDPDTGYVTDNQIIGIVHSKVLYIGYPSLWLREIFN